MNEIISLKLFLRIFTFDREDIKYFELNLALSDLFINI